MKDDGAFEVMAARVIDGLTEAELDALPFGAIQLDGKGTVLRYNRFECELARKEAANVIGRNFFADVAPCTEVSEFAGRFRQGVQEGELNAAFPFEFEFPWGKLRVTISLVCKGDVGCGWVFVTRRDV